MKRGNDVLFPASPCRKNAFGKTFSPRVSRFKHQRVLIRDNSFVVPNTNIGSEGVAYRPANGMETATG
jgi:hypothetical protein